MSKLYLVIIIIFFGLNIGSLKAEKFADNKIMVRFYSDIRNDESKMKAFGSQINAKIRPVLESTYSVRHNPKKFFEIQTTKLNFAEIQKTEEPVLRTYIIDFGKKVNPKAICKELKERFPEIEFAEPYHVYEFQSFTPNDQKYSLQTSLANIQPEEAWGIWRGSADVIIGISDNGVNQDHEDLTDNIAVNENEVPDNGFDDDGNGYIDDYRGFNCGGQLSGDWGNTFSGSIDHGSLVAGIASAKFNNSLGIAGIGGECKFFPIKAGGNTSSILYGYESIIYAATRKFQVLNLSWGGPQPFSEMEQSIINYATANGVAIVASGGNIGTNGATRYDTFYPANYKGVLGVAEVDEYDQITSSTSCMGIQTKILAPGKNNYSTSNWGNYTYVSTGTSFASPVVAGAVALARSKHPNLTPLQSLEFVRLCVDDVLSFNTAYTDKKLVPGRLNLLKVVTTDPFSFPAVRPIDIKFYNTSNQISNRFGVGDTVNIRISATNYLGSASNIKFTLSIGYDPMNCLKVTKAMNSLGSLATGESAVLDDFQVIINKSNTNRVILRLDIESDGGFKDFAKFDFIPTANFATFETEKIAFSMSDEANFGFVEIGNSKEGAGFTLKGIGNQLYGDSGLMISEDQSKLVTFVFSNFSTVKKFINPEGNINIINDDYTGSSDQIGLEIEQEVYFPHPNVAQLNIKAKNTSNRVLNDLSLGYYYDWDIEEDADSNVAILFDELNYSEEVKEFAAFGSELIYKPNSNIFVACAAFSKESGSTPQIAGLDYDYTSDFDYSKQMEVLNSGTNLQTNKIYDRSVFTGIKILGSIPPNDSRKISLLIGGDISRDALLENMKKAVKANSIISEAEDQQIEILTFPKMGIVKVKINEFSGDPKEITFFDINGQKIEAKLVSDEISNWRTMTYAMQYESNGIIFVWINSGLHNLTAKALWVE